MYLLEISISAFSPFLLNTLCFKVQFMTLSIVDAVQTAGPPVYTDGQVTSFRLESSVDCNTFNDIDNDLVFYYFSDIILS